MAVTPVFAPPPEGNQNRPLCGRDHHYNKPKEFFGTLSRPKEPDYQQTNA
jgi:hypothetical protein